MNNWRVLKFLLLGLALRLLLAPFLGHPFDLRVFMAVGWAVAHGITPYGQYRLQSIFSNMRHVHLYGNFLGIGYPPLWGLICGLMYLISSSLNNIYAYVFALKLPIIVGDLITALIIYKILREKLDEQIALKAFLLYLFCPYVLVVGVVWGMFDALAFLFTLLSACYLLKRKELSSVLLAVASVLKPIPLVLAPLYTIFVYKRARSWRSAIFYASSTAVLAIVFTFAPMEVFNWPVSNLYAALSYHVLAVNSAYEGGISPPYAHKMSFPYGAASPFNLIEFFNKGVNLNIQPPWFLNYVWIGACALVYLYVMRRVSRVDFISVVDWSLLTLLAFFTTRAWVSDPNLLFVFSFLLISAPFHDTFSWKPIHASWILLFSFVMIHVPAISFLWILYPWTLNAATAFCDGPMGWTRLLSMAALTLTWFASSWRWVVRRMPWS